MATITITEVKKEGPVIICCTDDSKGRCYRLNLQEGVAYGISGKPLNSTYSITRKIFSTMPRSPLIDAIEVFSYGGRLGPDFCQVVESMLSYPDLIPSKGIDFDFVRRVSNRYHSKLPKGFITWCRKNNRRISLYSLELFERDRYIDGWPQSLLIEVKRFENGSGIDLIEPTRGDKELCASMLSIIRNSLKRYEINTLFSEVTNIIRCVQQYPHLREYLDETKSAKVVLQILTEIRDKERNDKILAQESKIRGLDGMELDDLVIKVPASMNDFTDEGNQQHNCVGYFYHDSIAQGVNLIYFLRKTNTRDKSYVTCRYNIISHKTVETRTKNNGFYSNPQLFAKIDKIIRALLGD